MLAVAGAIQKVNFYPEYSGVDRAYAEAAYLGALVFWLVENKQDHQADAEIGEILWQKPFMKAVVIDALLAQTTSSGSGNG